MPLDENGRIIAEVKDYSVRKKRNLIKSTKVVCNTCNRKLGEVMETDPKLACDAEMKHIFVCPCGGESFVVKTKYTSFFLSDETLLTSSIQDIGTNKFRTTLENYNEDDTINSV